PRAPAAAPHETLWGRSGGGSTAGTLEENFQGKRSEFLLECPSVMDRSFRKLRSIKVENGSWVGFEYPEYQGQQFILEKGDYPRWEAWSGNSGYRTEHLLSFRPIK
uniref:Beta-crystallin A2 n=1 Tax=Terrapene triunguis TaxID=2587831 RepID=A0A674JI25_9SAUR